MTHANKAHRNRNQTQQGHCNRLAGSDQMEGVIDARARAGTIARVMANWAPRNWRKLVLIRAKDLLPSTDSGWLAP